MTTLLFCGDPHGVFGPMVDAALGAAPDGIVFLGDLCPDRPLERELAPLLEAGIPVAWIPGNHDADREDWLDGLARADGLITPGDIHGRVVKIAGVRVAGLGKVFRGRIWHPEVNGGRPRFRSRAEMTAALPHHQRWRKGVPLRHHGTLFHEDVDALRGLRADVLVTHEAPSTHPNGFAFLDGVAAELGVQAVFHGHHHVHYAAGLPGGARVHGVGIRGITALDGDIVLPGGFE
ncbi:metallophosphoesterase [Caenispirillum salinarum]|uniref:metallophosphoesterase family protein n=1 Tax=Caenispirillum salinarum TaxID=859058 RepID=UPI00384CE007